MRAIIDGKLYDSDNATFIASWANGPDPSNFNYCEQELYLTARGNWFLCYWGGARSGCGETYSDGSSGPGGGITALTCDEAKVWLEEHDEVDAVLTHFGDQVEAA